MKVIFTGSRYGLVLYCSTCGCSLDGGRDDGNGRRQVFMHPAPRKRTFWVSAVPACKYAGKAPVVELQEVK